MVFAKAVFSKYELYVYVSFDMVDAVQQLGAFLLNRVVTLASW